MVTSNPERAGRARAAYPQVRVEGSADAVWQRAGEHDLVVVASPNDSHMELAVRALEARLPVVVDKPMALSATAGRQLIARADQAGVPLTVFHNRRWDSDFLTAKRLLEAGELGDVWRFESRFERWRPELPAGSWRTSTAASRGGGVLLDLGTHLVDQALQLFGPVREVYGEIESRRGGPADDDAFLALRHDGGVRTHIWASEVAPDPGPRLRLVGSRGAFVVPGLDGQDEALRSGRRPGEGKWGVEPPERWGRLIRGHESELVHPEPGAWPVFYERLRDAIRGDGPVPVDPADAVAVAEVLGSAAR